MDLKNTNKQLPHIFDQKDIAVCLSGGGYRAALFHLGVLGYLNDIGLLRKVSKLSSVSGGSIFSAFLARKLIEHKIENGLDFADWEKQVADPFRQFVKHDLRTSPVLTNALWNWIYPSAQVKHLERKYSQKLTTLQTDLGTIRELKLGDLPEYPEFIFCSTNLTLGVNWEFRREESGDYQVGYTDESADWLLALAVTASSCFPPLFGPLEIDFSGYKFKRGKLKLEDLTGDFKISFTDGGVYDNLGLEPIDTTKNTKHDAIFVSDGGQPFGYANPAFFHQRVMRYTSNIMNHVLKQRIKNFKAFKYDPQDVDKLYANYNGAYFGIADGRSEKDTRKGFWGYRKNMVENLISRIRTDLDHFNSAESYVLENHGYSVAQRRMLRNFSGINEQKERLPHPIWIEDDAIEKALEKSHLRVSFKRLFAGLSAK